MCIFFRDRPKAQNVYHHSRFLTHFVETVVCRRRGGLMGSGTEAGLMKATSSSYLFFSR